MIIGTLYHRSIRYEQIFVQCDNIKTHVFTCGHMCSHVIHMIRTCGFFVRVMPRRVAKTTNTVIPSTTSRREPPNFFACSCRMSSPRKITWNGQVRQWLRHQMLLQSVHIRLTTTNPVRRPFEVLRWRTAASITVETCVTCRDQPGSNPELAERTTRQLGTAYVTHEFSIRNFDSRTV